MNTLLHSDDSALSPQRVSTAALLERATERLAAESDTPRLDADVLLAFATGRARASLLAFPERELEPDTTGRFAALVTRRANGEPLAYLTGRREFFSLVLEVSPEVLIPRPETELLVERTLARCVSLRRPKVLDVGTGSGAIALAVKHALSEALVTGADVSAEALAVARANAAWLGLDARWVESRWLEAFAGERFDVIASNPPYVRSAEVCGALKREPRLALDGGTDGLDAYRVLLAEAPNHLHPGGVLLIEHGAAQRPELVALAIDFGWRVAAEHDDLAGRPRVLELERSGVP